MNFVQKTVTVEDHVAKNGETRTVSLNSVPVEILNALRCNVPGSRAFMTPRSSKRSGKDRWGPYISFRTAFETACRHANLADVTPHDLSHTFPAGLSWAVWICKLCRNLGVA